MSYFETTGEAEKVLGEALWLLKRAYYEGDQEDWSKEVEELIRRVEDDLRL